MFRSLLSYCLVLFAAWTMKCNCGKYSPQNKVRIFVAIITQILLFYAIMNVGIFMSCLEYLSNLVQSIGKATSVATSALFGYVGGTDPACAPFDVKNSGYMFILAFQALANVVLVSGLAAILTYTRILPTISRFVGYFFGAIFRSNDSIGMYGVSKMFFGQMDSMLMIKSGSEYLVKHDMMTLMAMAFATSSAAVIPGYCGIISEVCPDAMRYIVSSNVINVISVLLLCMIIEPFDRGGKACHANPYNSFMSAMTTGINDGARVWGGIVCTLLGMTALVAFGDNLISSISPDLSIRKICGWLAYPFVYMLDIPSHDREFVSQIFGTRVAINEFLAFFDIAEYAKQYSLAPQSIRTSVYLVNNFGNFAALGITVSCFASMVPSLKKDILSVAYKAFLIGILATFMTASLSNIIL